MKRLILINQIFGRLVVLKFSFIKKNRSYWLCKCSCGNIKIISGHSLVRGKSTSCGCFARELTRERNKKIATKHGLRKLPIYFIWSSIKQRCLNPNVSNYKDYGGRGISICKRWSGKRGIIYFYADMGSEYELRTQKGEKISIDRIDVNGNYEPSNCRWITAKEQARNRRNSAKSNDYDLHMHWKHLFSKYISRIIHGTANCYTFCDNYLGITAQEFREYISSKFQKNMTLDNHGRGLTRWNVDHIKSLNLFDLSKEEDRKLAFHYTNLQPLWFKDNLEKANESI